MGELLLRRMGWKGEGALNPDGWNFCVPGGATLEKLAPLYGPIKKLNANGVIKPKKAKATIVAVPNEAHPLSSEAFAYGSPSDEPSEKYQLREITLNTDGVPRYTGKHIYCSPSDHMPVSRWGEGITGPTIVSFPEPKQWTFEGSMKPLDKLEVSDLTTLHAEKRRVNPTCMTRWQEHKLAIQPQGDHDTRWLPVDNTSNRIDFPKIADMYSTALLPPPYYNLHFKVHNTQIFYQHVATRRARQNGLPTRMRMHA